MNQKHPALQELNQFALNIEFLLISVIQGVALAALATAATPLITNFKIEYWPYVFSGFLFILVFWSQAILHALSFVDWPLDISHNFFYFLASFIEVVAFSVLGEPMKWFIMIFVFFLVTGILYIVDLRLIEKHRDKFQENTKRKNLFRDMYEGQLLELKAIIPAGLLFNAIAALLIFNFADFFITHHYHLILIFIQVIFGGLALLRTIRSFKRRSRLITEAAMSA